MKLTDCGELLAEFEMGRQALLASIEGLSDTEAAMRPSPECWSVIENIEHVAIVETNMLRRIREADPVVGDPPAERIAEIVEKVKVRAAKRQAPPTAHPTGECATIAAALEKFEVARKRTLELLQADDRDLHRHTIVHPAFGPVTVFECFHMIAAHPSRHAAQIREARQVR